MKALVREFLPLIVVLALLSTSGCATMGARTPGINIFTSDQEVEMGREFAEQVEEQFEIHDDKELAAYIQRVGDRVVAVSDRRDIDYFFGVIREDQINAFALPGGYIYIYTGLLKTLDDEAQLAAVLAHEVAHVTARHATQRLTAMYGYQFLVSLILGENPGVFAQLVSGIFSTTGFLAYSRANEFEADRLGTTYAFNAGYDPAGMTELLAKFIDTERRQPSKLESWLSTHPPTTDRIQYVESVIAELPAREGGLRNTDTFRRMQARLP